MKSISFFAAFAVLTISASAMADGFKCQTVEGDLNVKVYNHTSPAVGTRSVSTMIVSDPKVQGGRKTIAVFTSAKGTLDFHGTGVYEANVDLRMKESRRAGEYLVGTRLGELDTILLDLDFNYASPVEAGDLVTGEAIFTKRNGDIIERELVCERYLKGT